MLIKFFLQDAKSNLFEKITYGLWLNQVNNYYLALAPRGMAMSIDCTVSFMGKVVLDRDRYIQGSNGLRNNTNSSLTIIIRGTIGVGFLS